MKKTKNIKSDQQQPNSHKLEFMAIASVPLVLVLGNSMLVPILPELQEKLSISSFQSSLVISLFSVTAGLIIPIAGYLSDRFSRKAIIIPSLILYGTAGIGAGLAALWQSYPLLITARAIQGLGAAGTAPIAMALVGDLFKGGMESKALGLTEASNGFGKVVSPIFGSLLALIVWYAPFFAFPFFCLISLLCVIFLLQEPTKEQHPQKLKDYLKSIGNLLHTKGRWLITSFFAGAMALFVLFGVLFYLSDILEKPPYSIDGVKKGFILAVPLLGLVVASYMTGAKINKNGAAIRRLINIGLSLMTLSLGISIFIVHKNIYVFIGLLTVSSMGSGLLLPCLNTMIIGSVNRQQRGMITSIYSSLRFLGVAFGPPLFSWLMRMSHQLVFITVTAISLLTLILIFFLVKPEGEIQ